MKTKASEQVIRLRETDPKFVEFENKLDMIRKYHYKAGRYYTAWMYDYLSFLSKCPDINFQAEWEFPSKIRQRQLRKNYHKREFKKYQKPSDYPEEFETQISVILYDIIFDMTEEDWKEDNVTVSESGQVIYSAESDRILGKGQTFGDRERTRIIISNGEPRRVKVMIFEILKYLYLDGYQAETIASIFDISRSSVYNHKDEGLCELYKLYTERSQNNEKHS